MKIASTTNDIIVIIGFIAIQSDSQLLDEQPKLIYFGLRFCWNDCNDIKILLDFTKAAQNQGVEKQWETSGWNDEVRGRNTWSPTGDWKLIPGTADSRHSIFAIWKFSINNLYLISTFRHIDLVKPDDLPALGKHHKRFTADDCPWIRPRNWPSIMVNRLVKINAAG